MIRRKSATFSALAVAASTTLLAMPALAIQPARWTHNSEADFQAGETDNTVVTNLGDVKLASNTRIIGEMPEQASIIYDMQALGDGSLYLAAGPEAKLLRRSGNEIEEVASLGGQQIFALAIYRGELLAGISGENARLAVLRDGELVTLAELADTRYIWNILVQGDSIVLATGATGGVVRITPDKFDAEAEENPGLEVLLEAQQANVLCLGSDKQGRIYAGTDTDGLIYRIGFNDAGEPQPFVIYDADEPEIATLLVMDDGTVFAGTADAEQARPGRLGEAATEPAGRLEAPAAPAPGEQRPPEPGDLPQVPPEAQPIGQDNSNMPATDAGEAGESSDNADTAPETSQAPASPVEVPENETPAGMAAEPAAEVQSPAPAQEQVEQDGPATAEQRDRLREYIRERLQAARKSGSLQAGGRAPRAVRRAMPASGSRSQPISPGRPQQEGNAIYRIDPHGFVTEVFRESVMILRMVRSGNKLIVATGNEGQIFSVNPLTEETTTVVDLEPEQVPAVMLAPDGSVLLGTANPAQLVQLSEGFAGRGTYVSSVLDANQISLWGVLHLAATLPQGASVTVETRSGNVQDPEKAPWSEWSQANVVMPGEGISPLQPREITIDSPPARFMQYRLTLTGDQQTTPVVDRVELAYVTPNLGPKIASIRAAYPDAGPAQRGPGEDAAPPTAMNIEWEAADPNNDTLVYNLEYQPAGAKRYLSVAEDLEENRFEWQTRRIPDGWYILRVTASDRRDNPGDMAKTTSRRSDPVLVDNTPPTLENLAHEVQGDTLLVSGNAVDAFSPIRSIAYAVDDADEYKPVLPGDLIFDSTREQWVVTISDLSPGPHVVTLRVSDVRGNTGYKAMMIDISPED